MKRRREPLTRASDFAHFHRACGQRTIPRALHDHGFYGIDQAALPQNVLQPDLDLQTIRRAHAPGLSRPAYRRKVSASSPQKDGPAGLDSHRHRGGLCSVMSERQYNDEEVATIFERASETEHSGLPAPAEGKGLTLAELQDIGREVGISPESISIAARSLVGRTSGLAAVHGPADRRGTDGGIRSTAFRFGLGRPWSPTCARRSRRGA